MPQRNRTRVVGVPQNMATTWFVPFLSTPLDSLVRYMHSEGRYNIVDSLNALGISTRHARWGPVPSTAAGEPGQLHSLSNGWQPYLTDT